MNRPSAAALFLIIAFLPAAYAGQGTPIAPPDPAKAPIAFEYFRTSMRFENDGTGLSELNVKGIVFSTVLPDQGDIKLIRRGILSCSTLVNECEFKLIPAEVTKAGN